MDPDDLGVPDAAVVQSLAAERDRFLRFLLKRVGDSDLADDLLQTATIQALKSADTLRDDERVVAWVYRILRNVLVDHHRHAAASRRVLERVATFELPESAPPDVEDEICRCVSALVDTLPTAYAEILRLVELEGLTPSEAGELSGLTAGNARVRLHRARAALRERVDQMCRACAAHGCLDCTCGSGGAA